MHMMLKDGLRTMCQKGKKVKMVRRSQKAEKALTAKVMSQGKSSNTWNEHSTHLWTAGMDHGCTMDHGCSPSLSLPKPKKVSGDC